MPGRGGTLQRLRRWSWPARYPIAQFPSPPILIGLLALGLRYVTPAAWADALSAIGYVFVGAWAYLEMTAGLNAFRRALGVAGLAYIIVVVAQRIAG
jgi:hypothetical protein